MRMMGTTATKATGTTMYDSNGDESPSNKATTATATTTTTMNAMESVKDYDFDTKDDSGFDNTGNSDNHVDFLSEYSDSEFTDLDATNHSNGQYPCPISDAKEQLANELRKTLAKQENKAVVYLRFTAMIILLTITVIASGGAYTYTHNEEQDGFESEFTASSIRIKESFHESVSLQLASLDDFSTYITSYANADRNSNGKEHVFPNITIQDFDVRGANFRIVSKSFSLHWLPLVTDETRRGWESYVNMTYHHQIDDYVSEQEFIKRQDAMFGLIDDDDDDDKQDNGNMDDNGNSNINKNRKWVRSRSLQQQQQQQQQQSSSSESKAGVEWTSSSSTINNTSSTINNTFSPFITSPTLGTIQPYGTGPYFPIWQSSPVVPQESLLTTNALEYDPLRSGLLKVYNTHKAYIDEAIPPSETLLSELFLSHGQYRHQKETYEDDASTAIFYPVFDSYNLDKRSLVGVLIANVYWRLFFENILPPNIQGIVCVLKNNLNQAYSYRIDGRDVVYLGNDDFHDPRFDSMSIDTDVIKHISNEYASPETRSYTAVDIITSHNNNTDTDGTAIHYALHIYPSIDFQDQFITQKPKLYATVIAAIFIFTGIILMLYDCYVERRQQIVLEEAVKSTAVVHSLFPDTVHSRLYQNQGLNNADQSEDNNGENNDQAPPGRAKRRNSTFRRFYSVSNNDPMQTMWNNNGQYVNSDTDDENDVENNTNKNKNDRNSNSLDHFEKQDNKYHRSISSGDSGVDDESDESDNAGEIAWSRNISVGSNSTSKKENNSNDMRSSDIRNIANIANIANMANMANIGKMANLANPVNYIPKKVPNIGKINKVLVEKQQNINKMMHTVFIKRLEEFVRETGNTFLMRDNDNDDDNMSRASTVRGKIQRQYSFKKRPPIADQFMNTTVLFADLVGFTKWCSTRQPVEVFELLESLYQSFDRLATKRKVFKVETIGDCYMAVTGVPQPQADHALLMVRFARDILIKIKSVTAKLAPDLGEDTMDLSLRIGLHSGQVTGGVLRGEKSRFQLFGDTVNTAARMESTGIKGRIHCSQTTADEVIKSGKGHWIVPREDVIFAKGKGEMQTYLLDKLWTVKSLNGNASMISGGPLSSEDGDFEFDNLTTDGDFDFTMEDGIIDEMINETSEREHSTSEKDNIATLPALTAGMTTSSSRSSSIEENMDFIYDEINDELIEKAISKQQYDDENDESEKKEDYYDDDEGVITSTNNSTDDNKDFIYDDNNDEKMENAISIQQFDENDKSEKKEDYYEDSDEGVIIKA